MKRKSILFMTDWHDPRVERGVVQYAREANWHLCIESLYSGLVPWGWKGDGCLSHITCDETAKFIRSLRIPVVDMTHTYEKLKVHRARYDDVAIGAMAAEHFVKKRFSHLLWCSYDEQPVSRDRHAGFSQLLASRGLSCASLIMPQEEAKRPTTQRWASSRNWLSRMIRQAPKPLGLFCVDDRLAVSAVEVCVDTGIPVPEDVAVLGVGDLETACECSAVPLSSIALDYFQNGYQAAHLLDQVISQKTKSPQERIFSPVGIIERKSTQALAVENPELQKAIQIMLQDFGSPINVNSIADQAGLSRSMLNQLCAREFHIGPAALLERIRLHHAEKMLKAKKEKIYAVAQESGFGSSLRLNRALKRVHHQTPKDFRNHGLETPEEHGTANGRE